MLRKARKTGTRKEEFVGICSYRIAERRFAGCTVGNTGRPSDGNTGKHSVGNTGGPSAGKRHGLHGLSASMTLEAAIVVPLCLFFVMNVLFVMEIVRLQSGLQAALQQTGEQICEMAYYTRFGGGAVPEGADAGEGIGSGDAASFALSETFVRSRVVSYLGKSYLDHTCLEGGAAGLSFAGCKIMTQGGKVDLIVNYRVRPFVRVVAPGTFPMQARFCGHAWVGWSPGDGAQGGDSGGSQPDNVYVTKYGEVYHTDSGCIYLNPQVRSVPGSMVDSCRSGDGSKYYPCEYCHPNKNGAVYITKEGNRYHSSRDCGAITRHVREMDTEAAHDHLRPCPICGNGKQQ